MYLDLYIYTRDKTSYLLICFLFLDPNTRIESQSIQSKPSYYATLTEVKKKRFYTEVIYA